jgi:hypothetical protein
MLKKLFARDFYENFNLFAHILITIMIHMKILTCLFARDFYLKLYKII